ncbi:MAG: RICIN domain-containing protein, partial [Clostridia bacterium]|nr:RICIN domain-containing protein [Clostridia bacterium]
MKKRLTSLLVALTMVFGMQIYMPGVVASAKEPQYQTNSRIMERLNRGLIAVRTYASAQNGVTGGVYLSWRLLGDESLSNQAFDIYRNDEKIYTTGVHDATNYTDTAGTETDVYKVVKAGSSPDVVSAEEGVTAFSVHNKTARNSLAGNGTSRPNSFSYVDIPLSRPANVTNYGGGTSTYYGNGGANDASLGDIDGDGDYEFILKWTPSDAKDSASGGYTGNVYIDAYEISENNGGYKWRIDLGKNICAGAHYTQFIVYDFDNDGKSEIAMKTAPGSKDGTGRYVTEVGDTSAIRNADNSAVYLNSRGVQASGGEYITIFDGETGRALKTTSGIPLGDVNSWGDNYYNRSERYLAAVAYIDGVNPHFIECRGYYAKAIVRAYKWDGSDLTLVWEHDGTNNSSSTIHGQGNHNLSVADVDNDGKDEIVYGSAVLDDNGKVIGNTRLWHGDAMHVSDFNNDGVQEVFSVKESSTGYANNAADFRVASTGKNIFGVGAGGDTGRGVMANVDDEYAKTHPNALSIGWSSSHGESFDLTGATVAARPSTSSRMMTNFLVYWDGDLSREMLDDNQLAKYDATNGWTLRFYNDGNGYMPGASINGSKQNPALVADLWGDWREEIIMPTGTGEGETPYLRILTSTIPTSYRLTTLMHDCQYRMAIAWQNVGYNQPPHQSYYIGSAALATDSSGNTLNYLAPATPFTKVEYAREADAVETEVIDSAVYMFRNVNSNLYLDVTGGAAADGTNVQQWGASYPGGSYNNWKIVDAGDGWYQIYSMVGDGNTYVLDV